MLFIEFFNNKRNAEYDVKWKNTGQSVVHTVWAYVKHTYSETD